MGSNCIDDWQNERGVLGSNKYMLDHQIDCDVTFQLENFEERVVTIRAHKYVLVSRSPVFFAMLNGPLAEKNKHIRITDVTPEGFWNLLRFLYHEQVELGFENVFQVLYAAKKYIVSALVKLCVQHLEDIVKPENACLILDQSVLLEDSLETKCVSIIQRHTKKVLISETFYKVSNLTLCKILKCGGLSLSEVEVFKACLKWAELQCTAHQLEQTPENNRQMLGKALFLVHIPSIPLADFTQVVVPSKLLSMQEENMMFKYFMGDQSLVSELPFPVSTREFFAFNCRVFYDGYVRNSTVVTPYNGFIRRSRWSIIFQVDSSIKLHEIGLLGDFCGIMSILQNDIKKFEVSLSSPEKTIKLEQDLLVEAGQFTIVTDVSNSYSGDYYYKSVASRVPRTDCECDHVVIQAKECTTISMISHFAFTHSEDMQFIDDYFTHSVDPEQE